MTKQQLIDYIVKIKAVIALMECSIADGTDGFYGEWVCSKCGATKLTHKMSCECGSLSFYIAKDCYNASGEKIKQGQLVNIQNGVISGATGQETAKESIPVVCNCCGNKNRPVMDSGFCIICEKDATPETYSVKRKFCGDCSQQLPGFYPIDDTDITICEKCIEKRR